MAKLIKNISCVLIVKNAESTIKEVLTALNVFDDIVIYANNSTDKTVSIINNFANVNLIEGEFLGFGATKNKAASYAKYNWVLSLDADEIASPEFIANLQQLNLNDNYVYSLLRTNHYKNIEIKHCWGKDKIVRLYNKNLTRFTDTKVHEKIIDKNLKIQIIKGTVRHYPYATITDFIIKLDRYSSIFAQDNQGKKNSSPLKAIVNAQFSFLKTYFLKRGFLDGYAGLVIAFSHMATNFYKYIKLYELNKSSKNNNDNFNN